MRWRRGGGRSSDVIDARASGGGPGRGITIPGGVGIAGVIVYLLIQVLSGGAGSAGAFDVDSPFGQAPAAPAADGGGIPAAQDPERDLKEFSAYVFTNALDTWEQLFREDGEPFERAKVVLYRQAVRTGCGDASSAVGPFYCPADQRVYLDLSFYGDMETQLGAPGDFAWAYVIAHEVAHHVQQQLGTSGEVSRLQRESPDEANGLSVRLELQALLCRRLGPQRLRRGRPREGRRPRGLRRLGGRGRRPPPAPVRRAGEPGLLHARELGAADRLVQPRPGERRARRLRHVQPGEPVARPGHPAGTSGRAPRPARRRSSAVRVSPCA